MKFDSRRPLRSLVIGGLDIWDPWKWKGLGFLVVPLESQIPQQPQNLKKSPKPYPPVNKHSNGKSPVSIGNTSSNGGGSQIIFVIQRCLHWQLRHRLDGRERFDAIFHRWPGEGTSYGKPSSPIPSWTGADRSFYSRVVFIMLMGKNPANQLYQLRLVVYPIIYKVLYIPGGERRMSEPSRVQHDGSSPAQESCICIYYSSPSFTLTNHRLFVDAPEGKFRRKSRCMWF